MRPWQHAIEPLAGYLRLAEQLVNEPVRFAEAWNFGPPAEERVEVGAVVERFVAAMGRGDVTFGEVDRNAPHEASELRLDSAKSRLLLPWTPRLSLDGGAIVARDQAGHAMRVGRGGLVERSAPSTRWER